MIIEYKEGDYVYFTVRNLQVREASADAELFETTAWNLDNTVAEEEKCLDFYLKWDGCLELSIPQYHICGTEHFKRFLRVLEWLHKEISTHIPSFED